MGWVIKDSKDKMYRTMQQGNIGWTENYQKAIHFSRKVDAELFSIEDEDAYIIRFEPFDLIDNAGFFNRLSPAEAERLWLLVEEMGESLQAIGKIGRHGYESFNPTGLFGDPNNRGELEKEIGHVYRIIKMLSRAGDISWERLLSHEVVKASSMKPYLHHQSEG